MLGLLVGFLVGCDSSLPKPSMEENLRIGDHEFIAEKAASEMLAAHSNAPCDPRSMPGYRTASPLARSIADGETWDFNDELASLALIDSFQASQNRAFYSAILLRTLERADGYYGEPLGIALHAELLEHPCSLLSCCWENGCDGREGLLLWTKAIAMEIIIDHEEDPWAAFVNYGKQVEARAKAECDLQTRSRANELLYEIEAHLKHALQRDSISASR
jgi:hypothetical protein